MKNNELSEYNCKYRKGEVIGYIERIYIYNQYEQKQLKSVILYNKNKEIHHDNKPAYLLFDDNGVLIKESYYNQGKLHREDGPAVIDYENGEVVKIQYYYQGMLNNSKGPAITKYKYQEVVYEEWLESGAINNLKGAAKIWYKNKTVLKEEYFIYNILYTNKKDFKRAIALL